MLTTRRTRAVLVYEVVLEALPSTAEWQLGPLVIEVPGSSEVTDEAWRSQGIREHACPALYGGTRRWHRALDGEEHLPSTKLTPTAVEMLRFARYEGDKTNAVLAVHATAGSDGSALVADLKRCARGLIVPGSEPLRRAVERLAPGQSALAPCARSATVLIFATHAPGSRLDGESAWDGGSSTWSELDQWRWSLAAASPPSKRALRAPRLPAMPGRLVRIPRREAQVLSDGTAILSTRPDTDAAAAARYDFDFAATASIYLDALLLGITQRIMVAQLSEAARDLGDPVVRPRRLRALQRDIRIFRNQSWWRDVSTWKWPDAILRAYQEEHALPDRLEQLVEEIGDFGAEVRVVSDQRLGEFLGIIALLGIPAAGASILEALHVSGATAGRWLIAIGVVVAAPLGVLCVRVITSFLPSDTIGKRSKRRELDRHARSRRSHNG